MSLHRLSNLITALGALALMAMSGRVVSADTGVTVSLGSVNSGVVATDKRVGQGFVLWSEQNIFTRFAGHTPNADASTNLIIVVWDGTQWLYDDNATLRPFTPVSTDVLIAMVEFGGSSNIDSITSLQGINATYNGIAEGYASGDLTFIANQYGGSANTGEWTITGTQFTKNGPLPTNYDVVVYEGTPGGVMAAVAAGRQGHSVLLIEMNNHVGGVVSGGLCYSDIGDRNTVGGLSNDFFNRVVAYYTANYGAGSAQLAASANGIKFEPHVAELIFDQMLAEQHVSVLRRHRIDLRVANSVTQDASGNITSVTVQDMANGGGKTFTGKVYIDASYEGDLMAGAHVPYTYGREGRSQYGEYLAGNRVPGDTFGESDSLIMSYNHRVSLIQDTTTGSPARILFPKPVNYDYAKYNSLYRSRIVNGTYTQFIQFYASGPGRAGPLGQLDTNWFDFAGSSTGYADGDWATRAQIIATMRDNALSMLYYLQHDTKGLRAGDAFYNDMQTWGLPAVEFADTQFEDAGAAALPANYFSHYPFQFYIREARRMVGQYVMQESDITQNRYKLDGIGTGSYGTDCHIVQDLTINGKRVVDQTPHLDTPPYDIPYRSLIPSSAAGQPGNLLVPVCCSTSHVVYCSLRMEPVFMMLGHAAGDAAHLAIANNTPVQQVDTVQLRSLLTGEGALLDCGYAPPVQITFSPAHPQVGQAVQFTLANVSTPKNTLTNIWWDFEGAGSVGATGTSAQYSFGLNKVYNVSAIVEDASGRRMVNAQVPVGAATAQDVTLDDYDGTYVGSWDGFYPRINKNNQKPDAFLGPGMHIIKSATATATFQPTIPRPGRYQLCFAYRPDTGQPASLPVTIVSAAGTTQVTVNETTHAAASPFPLVSLGTYSFNAGTGSSVSVATSDASVTSVIDGLRWVSLGDFPTVSIAATTSVAVEPPSGGSAQNGLFTVTRTGDTTNALTVNYTVSGTATNGTDDTALPGSITIPAGATTATITVTPLSDTTPEGDETVVLTLANSTAYDFGLTPSATVTIQDRPFDAWRFAHFNTSQLGDATISGATATPARDGLSNLAKYALGLPPLAPQMNPPWTLGSTTVSGQKYLTATYTLDKSSPDVTCTPEVSSDLVHWSSGDVFTIQTLGASTDTTQTYLTRDLTPMTSSARRFIRLRFDLVP